MSRMRLAAPLLAMLVYAAPPATVAFADTDYRCLGSCMNVGGTPASQCLSQCTYAPLNAMSAPPSAEQALTLPQSRHSQFNAPIPSNQGDVYLDLSAAPPAAPNVTPPKSLSPTTQPLGPSTNYKCVQDCLKLGYQHDLCFESCSY